MISSHPIRIITIPVLILLGLAVSGYLIYQQQHLHVGGSPDFCSAVFGKGCSAALGSSFSTRFGLSLAGWGFLYYAVMGVLFISMTSRKTFLSGSLFVAGSLSFFAVITSLVLLALMVRHPELICPACIFLHAVNMFLFVLINSLAGSFVSVLLKQPLHTTKLIWFSIKINAERSRQAVGYGLIILFALVLYGGLRTFSSAGHTASTPVFDKQQSMKAFYAQAGNSIPVDTEDPVWGDRHTPVEVVVFSDFECPACRYFFGVMQTLQKEYAGKYHVVFKPFPLGLACNASIHTDIHPRACEVAWAAAAAREQGKFWSFHDALFSTGVEKQGPTVSSIASNIGLDVERFELERSGAAAQQWVKRSVQQGVVLGVNSTPAIFINGRRAADMRLLYMESVFDRELEGYRKK